MTDQPNRTAPLPPIAELRAVAEAARKRGQQLISAPEFALALLDRVEALEAGLREALEMNEAGGHELSWERLRGPLLDH